MLFNTARFHYVRRILLECAPYDAACAECALTLLSNMMLEDDENVETYFLMGVAFFSQSPPDLELATEYLQRARTMLDANRGAWAVEMGEFPFEEQSRLVDQQVAVVEQYRAEHAGEAEADEEDEEDPDDGEAADEQMGEAGEAGEGGAE